MGKKSYLGLPEGLLQSGRARDLFIVLTYFLGYRTDIFANFTSCTVLFPNLNYQTLGVIWIQPKYMDPTVSGSVTLILLLEPQKLRTKNLRKV